MLIAALFGTIVVATRLIRCCGPWSLDAVFKAGVYGDFADRDFQLAINGNPVEGVRNDDSDAAFVGEIGIAAAYALNDCWSLRGG